MPCTHVHTDDLRGSLTLLTQALIGRRQADRVRVPRRGGAAPSCGRRRTDGAGVRYRDAMAVLDAALPDGSTSSSTPGNTGAAAIHYLPVRRDGRFVVALGMGGMGYSFGAGVGMAFGTATRRTVVIAGDGSFFMHGMEIHTALQYRLPVTFVLFNNNAHAMCVTREQLFYDDLYSYNRFGAEPARRRAGRDVPRACSRSTSTTSTICPPRCGPRSTSTGRRWSASSARPTKSRRSHPFSAMPPPTVNTTVHHKGESRPMSLPALDDITAHRGTVEPIDGVIRIETAPREKATPIIMEMMRSVYPHDQVFGEYCTVNDYIDCPPDELFDYLSDTRSLEEWTYSLRGFAPTEEPGLWLAYDRLGIGDRDLHPHGGQPGGDAPSTTTARGTRASTCG